MHDLLTFCLPLQVPHSLYPDSFNAMNSYAMGSLITTKLREDALKLRKLAAGSVTAKASLQGVKEKMLREVHLILTLMLGPPPSPSKEFTWDYYDSNDKFHSVNTTPLKFARELSSPESVRACAGTDVHELFSLVNDPRNAYGELLSVDRLGNVVGARGITYVNVDMPVSLPPSCRIARETVLKAPRQSKPPASPCSNPASQSSSAPTSANSVLRPLVSWTRNWSTTN